MRKFVLAAACTLALVGWVMAEEFTLTISKISDDGTTVTGTKKGKGGKGGGGKKGEEVTVKVASNVKVFKGKFDMDTKGFVADGDDLKLAGLKNAVRAAENGNVTVGGKTIAATDVLELTVKDGKPAAKLNGKAIDFADVSVKGKGTVTAAVTTNDDGTITQAILTPGFGGGFGGKGGKGGGKAGGGGN